MEKIIIKFTNKYLFL